MNKISIASVAIINNKKELLLVRKKNSTYFQLVGGKIMENESYEETVIRETQEEIGFTLNINKLNKLGTHQSKAVNEKNTLVEGHIFYYYIEDNKQPKIDNEIEEYAWISINNHQKYQWAHLAKEFVFPFWLELNNN